MKYVSYNTLLYFWQKLKEKLNEKFDKAGGEITGSVQIDGNLTLDIPDEDYDAGIQITKALDDNLGTTMTLTGYAHGESQTWYKTLLRNIATPNSDYDAANKKYVDDMSSVPSLHLVDLNTDGSVNLAASTLVYDTIKSNLTNPKRSDYLDVFWENGAGSDSYTRFQAYPMEVTDVNTGDIMFEAEIFYMGYPVWMVFSLNSSNVLTTTAIMRREDVSNKTTDIVANSASNILYPTAKAVFDQFQRKPVVVWQAATLADGFMCTGEEVAADGMTWQITGLDMTPFSRVKLFIRSGGTGSGTTVSCVLEVDLDEMNKSDYGHYVVSAVGQNPNNRNRLYLATCAVSGDKTSVTFLRQTSLYGTAATGANSDNRILYKVEGYYD